MKHIAEGSRSVDIESLMRVLPISGLEPQVIGSIQGLIETPSDRPWQDCINVLEPPAGRRVPYIDPGKALDVLLRGQGAAPEDAKALVLESIARMRAGVEDARWVNFYDDAEPESPECLPLPDFVAWLRVERCCASGKMRVPEPVLDFIEQASAVVMQSSEFRGPDNRDSPWTLENLPALPPPKAMIEFVPGSPWADHEDGNWVDDPNAYYPVYTPFQRWRESMRPVAQQLETALGEPVYYFADLSCDHDDDDVHRFLVLHWCCTWKPESAFVRYLLKVTGARDVEALKAALIDPASYTHPFKMNGSFDGLEASPCCFLTYLPPGVHKTVGIVFMTEQAREVAQALLAQQIGAHAFIVAPKELATDAWVKHAARYCREWTVRYVYDGKLDEPIDILAPVDELCVIANEPTPNSGFDLKLSEPAEDLLWLALDLGVEARYYHVDRGRLANPELCLQKRGVPERMAAQKAQRAAYTRQLQEIRLDNDFGSSGLWDDEGRSLGYDLVDLCFPLVRRIAAWQRNYDDTRNPPGMGDEAWWQRHEKEALDLAKELQTALGENTTIKLYRKQGWMSVDEVIQDEGGES